jgi:cytochrome c-type biogenesis protein CcmH/NrfG
MSDNTSNTSNWTSTQAYVLAVICLVVGAALGYLVRGSETAKPAAVATTENAAAPQGMGGMNGMGGGQMPSPEQMRHMVEKQAEPLFTKLKSNPNDAATLAGIGNVYYDAQLYPDAIEYYDKSLKIDPKNASVRTDMGTAYFYTGNADRAIEEFKKSLQYDPKHGQTLFNLGQVQWQGKGDVKAAVETWEILLKTVPDYPEHDKVQSLVDQAKKHMNMPAGTKTEKPAKM